MEATVETKLTIEHIKVFDELLVEMGREIPIDFIGLLHDSAYEALKSYLTKHQAPEEVLKLIEDLDLMMMIQEERHHGELPEPSAQMLIETIGPMTNRIVKLGGLFEAWGSWGGVEVVNWPGKES